ncbi:MAG: HAMP domain-containing sensor histidine kinase [Oscillospiraceae bacterium]
MNMQKSLFRKYLIITMGIVLASYVVLGSVMMVFFSGYWQNEKKELLTQNATSIATFAGQYTKYAEEKNQYQINAPALSVFIDVIAKNIDADIFITDLEGERFMGAYSNSHLQGNLPPVDKAYVTKAASGFCEIRSNFGNTYSKDYYAVGIPFKIKKTDGTEGIAGAVFAATNSSSIVAYQLATFQMFLIAAIVTLLLTFVVVWLFTYRMIRPLRRMSVATKAFGNGDFSVRVPVESSDEIGELSVAFNIMANSLSNSEGMRRSFIANVSHELKTPMTTIAGFIDGILDGTIPENKQRSYLKIVSDEIKRLSRLVKSMLDLSRIDSGEMKLNPVKFDLTETVFSTLLTFEKSIEEKEIHIKGLEESGPQMVLGDQDLLHQVVYNLIENAVKFTNQGGYIAFVLTDSFDRTCFSIENSGQGISSDDLPMIFDRFYKTDKSRSRDKNGMGLGLYLVKTIMKLHSGDITVQSAVDQFCRFELYIPKPTDTVKKVSDGSVIAIGEKAGDEVDIQDVE